MNESKAHVRKLPDHRTFSLLVGFQVLISSLEKLDSVSVIHVCYIVELFIFISTNFSAASLSHVNTGLQKHKLKKLAFSPSSICFIDAPFHHSKLPTHNLSESTYLCFTPDPLLLIGHSIEIKYFNYLNPHIQQILIIPFPQISRSTRKNYVYRKLFSKKCRIFR